MKKHIAILLSSIALAASAQAAAKPNFLFILVDDLGRQDMSCEGSAFHETPNIDRIASQSMRFSNGYSACQVCSPSRAAIQTGKYPARVDVAITDYIGGTTGRNQPDKWNRNTRLLPARYEMEMKLKEVTIAEAMKEAGYTTFFAGKWHLGHEGHGPEDQGYDVNKGGHLAGTPPGGYFPPYNNPTLEDGILLPIGEGQSEVFVFATHGRQVANIPAGAQSVERPRSQRNIPVYDLRKRNCAWR